MCVFKPQKALRAKEYECFVMKIGRLENLCRALQEERNELYKKIREAKVSEKEDQSQHSSDEEPEANVSVDKERDAEEADRVENAVANLAAAFQVIQRPEPSFQPSEAMPPARGGPRGSGGSAPGEPAGSPPLPPGGSADPRPPPVPQAESQGGEEAKPAPEVSSPLVQAGAEPRAQSLPEAPQAVELPRKSEVGASGQASQVASEASPHRVEAEGSTPPPPAHEQVPAGPPGGEPSEQPLPAASEELCPGAPTPLQLPTVADPSLERVD